MATRRIFTREFKPEAVKMVIERGVSIAQGARDLGLHENVPRKWVQRCLGTEARKGVTCVGRPTATAGERKRQGAALGSLLLACVLTGCGRISVGTAPYIVTADARTPVPTLTVDRTIALDLYMGDNMRIVRRPSGGLLMLGSQRLAARAVALDDQGRELWRYEQSVSGLKPGMYPYDASNFQDVAFLPNGNIFLCGRQPLKSTTIPAYENDIVILDADGKLVDRHNEPLGLGDGWESREFRQCSVVDQHIVLVSFIEKTSKNSQTGVFDTTFKIWLLTLDLNGKRVSESVLDGSEPLSNSGDAGDTVFTEFSTNPPGPDARQWLRVTPEGRIEARRILPSTTRLLSAAPRVAGTWLLDHQIAPRPKDPDYLGVPQGRGYLGLYGLNESLKYVAAPWFVSTDFEPKGGIVRADHSLVVFGRAHSAAMAWIGAGGHGSSMVEFDQRYSAFTAGAGVALSDTQFLVACHGFYGPANAPKSAMYLSWVTLR